MNTDLPSSESASGAPLPADRTAPKQMVQLLTEAASRVLRRRFRVVYLIREAYDRMTAHPNVLSAVWTDLRTMLRLLVRWADASYRRVSWTPLVLIVGALIYFVTPVDVLPDTLGAIGFVDDITVISTVVHHVRDELQRFRNWENDRVLPE